MFWQMFLAFGLLIVLALAGLGAVVGDWVEQQALGQVEERLKSKAVLLVEIARDRRTDELQSRIQALRDKIDTRITMIASDGHVVVESESDPADLDDHGKRPEVEAARTAPFGVATRHSKSLKKNMMYVALRTTNVPGVAFVRVAVPVTELQSQAGDLQHLVWIAAAGMAMVALIVAWVLTRRLVQPLQQLTAGAEQIAAGGIRTQGLYRAARRTGPPCLGVQSYERPLGGAIRATR